KYGFNKKGRFCKTEVRRNGLGSSSCSCRGMGDGVETALLDMCNGWRDIIRSMTRVPPPRYCGCGWCCGVLVMGLAVVLRVVVVVLVLRVMVVKDCIRAPMGPCVILESGNKL